MTTYPFAPGAKTCGTSADSAARMTSGVASLRARVLLVMVAGAELTPDEIAALLGETVLAIRPRCSELLRMGAIRKTSLRRPNLSGHSATVLAVAE